MPRKYVGSAVFAITFPNFLTENERYNLLDYFGMGIIKEIRFFFFDAEDLARDLANIGPS